jgi:hypothetical protein
LAGPICVSDECIRVPFEADLHNLYNVHENTAVIKLLGDQTSVSASTRKFSERWVLFQIDVAGRWRGLCHLVTVILLSRPIESRIVENCYDEARMSCNVRVLLHEAVLSHVLQLARQD